MGKADPIINHVKKHVKERVKWLIIQIKKRLYGKTSLPKVFFMPFSSQFQI